MPRAKKLHLRKLNKQLACDIRDRMLKLCNDVTAHEAGVDTPQAVIDTIASYAKGVEDCPCVKHESMAAWFYCCAVTLHDVLADESVAWTPKQKVLLSKVILTFTHVGANLISLMSDVLSSAHYTLMDRASPEANKARARMFAARAKKNEASN